MFHILDLIHRLTPFLCITLSVSLVHICLDAQVKGMQLLLVPIMQQTVLRWFVHALRDQLGSWQQQQARCWFSRLWQLWQLNMFLLCKSFLWFLTSYSTWRIPSQLRPSASTHTARSFREKSPGTIISIAGVSFFDNPAHSQEELLTTNKEHVMIS